MNIPIKHLNEVLLLISLMSYPYGDYFATIFIRIKVGV